VTPKLDLIKPLENQGKLVSPSREPPTNLREPGQNLWRAVMAEYRITDVAGLTMLAQACASLDRAEALRARIDNEGETIKTPHGIKSHPAIKDELANRSFVVRTLERLGLTVEPVRPVGRPPRDNHWADE
jgi:hypothetical protein